VRNNRDKKSHFVPSEGGWGEGVANGEAGLLFLVIGQLSLVICGIFLLHCCMVRLTPNITLILAGLQGFACQKRSAQQKLEGR
jgi:hypothetical protein